MEQPPRAKSDTSIKAFAFSGSHQVDKQVDLDNWSLTSTTKGDTPKHQVACSTRLTIRHHSVTSSEPTGGQSPEFPKKYFNVSKTLRVRRATERFSKGIGYHLGRRRRLLEYRRRVADFALAFGIFGIFAAFLDTELVTRAVYSKVSMIIVCLLVMTNS